MRAFPSCKYQRMAHEPIPLSAPLVMGTISAHGTIRVSADAMCSVMWNGICLPTDRGYTSRPEYTKSRRSPPLSSASLPRHKPRAQHVCTNPLHSDLGD